MRVVVIGMGVQGHKRRAAAGKACVATIDPVNMEADFKTIEDVALADYDAALVCTPDEAKLELLTYLLGNGKHVLVEKPLLAATDAEIEKLAALAKSNNAVCYTAYNHRFEPHFVRMKKLIDSGDLGEIYALRMFYGNGTARLVRNSAWRDQAAGVLPDLGSHLLDTVRFWLGEDYASNFEMRGAFCHENKSFDHVIIGSNDGPAIQLEMTMLSWRNHFTCDIFAEKGSAHIESLCKWGPSTFIHRERVLPAGRPPEESHTLVQEDPTWVDEYNHFIELCQSGSEGNIANDIWLNETLRNLARQVGVDSILPEGNKA
ncbi:MAG: Gfo/Idh/MocA family oxidoreductase [Mariprofundaceae bacterium]|nr:Gfo/Idh/MocA family oxidoreductase [Mariprofundaceae bacterium]